MTINDNTWHHVAAVYDGANVTLYVDGSSDGSVAKTGNLTTSSRNVRIGARHTTSMGEYFTGIIDDVRIYNKALSASEIQQIHDNGQ